MKNTFGKKGWIHIQSGFTLIELLIVMAIIGVLASLLLTSFIGVRERARDGRRKSDISQMQAALEQYRADNADYPNSSTLSTCGGSLGAGSSTYMQKIPCDPLGTGSGIWNGGVYLYNYIGSGQYSLSFCVENGSDTDPHISSSLPSGVTPSGTCTSGKYYTVYNP
ncbi:MAG: prepilin-type N-terminal cleavage/methylation domain-containing protein [Patescibacteria group bacterium]|nr:prepilin-type N-terminal cleavage/methylation domain-containing protein [Patescibacteria group bacterium]